MAAGDSFASTGPNSDIHSTDTHGYSVIVATCNYKSLGLHLSSISDPN